MLSLEYIGKSPVTIYSADISFKFRQSVRHQKNGTDGLNFGFDGWWLMAIRHRHQGTLFATCIRGLGCSVRCKARNIRNCPKRSKVYPFCRYSATSMGYSPRPPPLPRITYKSSFVAPYHTISKQLLVHSHESAPNERSRTDQVN